MPIIAAQLQLLIPLRIIVQITISTLPALVYLAQPVRSNASHRRQVEWLYLVFHSVMLRVVDALLVACALVYLR